MSQNLSGVFGSSTEREILLGYGPNACLGGRCLWGFQRSRLARREVLRGEDPEDPVTNLVEMG